MTHGTESRISFGNTTCKMGKVYIALSITDDLRKNRFLASLRTRSGTELPAKIVDWKHGDQLVLVVPAVGPLQRCVVTAIDESGSVAAQATHFVHPVPSRAESVARSALGELASRRIACCDERPNDGRFAVAVERIVNAAGGDFHVKGTVTVTGQHAGEVSEDVIIRLIDGNGENALEDELVIVRDSISGCGDYPDSARRVISFSGRIKQHARQLIVWARSCNDKTAGDFKVLTTRGLARYKNDWTSLSTSVDQDGRYDLWYRTKHATGRHELALQAAHKFPHEPLFSVIVPLYNTPLDYFREMADSVLRQSYGKLELVLVNGTTDNAELSSAIAEYARRDRRIVIVDLDRNLGIAENTNAGIHAARGDFLCFLDHDDMLTDDALFCYAKAINDYPETDLLYSDEDNYDNGLYVTPYFKPDWNPDLLLGMNYICHFLCVRKSIVDEMKLPSSELDGAQDYHMALYVSERARNVFHARRILYHWRIHPASTASGIDAKPYAITAGKRALEHYLERNGIDGSVGHPEGLPDRYEIEYALPERPLVSIIIPNKDSVNILDRCLRSILSKTTYENYEIIVVENNSESLDTFEYYEKLPDLDGRIRVVFFDGPFNYSRINNFGAQNAAGDYLLLLNNDTEVLTPDWLERMLSLCIRENTGIVGAKLLYPDGTVQHAGVVITNDVPFHVNMHRDNSCNGYYESLKLRQDYSAVTGACLMTKRTVFDEVGGLDEEFPLDYNDIDYCLSVRAAEYLVALDPGTELLHYESASRGFHPSFKSQLQFTEALGRLKQKWPRYFTGADPMGNPNFEQTGIWAAYHHGKL